MGQRCRKVCRASVSTISTGGDGGEKGLGKPQFLGMISAPSVENSKVVECWCSKGFEWWRLLVEVVEMVEATGGESRG